MMRVLEVIFFALMFGAAVLPWPWNGVALAILIPGALIAGGVTIFAETREWMQRRRLRRSAWL